MGRPTVFNDSVLSKLQHAFALACSDRDACFYAGISPEALYDYQRENPEFIQKKYALKLNPVFKAKKVIDIALDIGDKDIAKWYLERKCKDEFSTKQEQDISGMLVNVQVDNSKVDDFIAAINQTIKDA
ncbi:MAG: hypothetical protein LBK53_09415 [Heliobacteriaceae bacterium]|nr:hypothetical protein [Heliobacteriaceae bacterium]